MSTDRFQEGGRYDMIFDLDPQLIRVQCKWASRQPRLSGQS
jgi:hypothetical protein